MEKFKVTCTEDNKIFVVTAAFSSLYKKFKDLKTQKGRIILITGSPGTGKSSNIYHAQNLLNLNFYDVQLELSSLKLNPQGVIEEFINTLKRDFNVKTKKEAYNELSKFDAVLFADKFLDTGDLSKNKIELTQWIRYNRIKSIMFYIVVIYELLSNINNLKKVNLIFHVTWTFMFRNKKYDLLSDFGFLSLLFRMFLKLIFEVVEIKYTQSETIEIVKSHFEGIKDPQIVKFIDKYGNKPRYVLGAIEKNLINLKISQPDIKAVENVCKINENP